jgi:pyridoxamine 5'-phosphate oxidase
MTPPVSVADLRREYALARLDEKDVSRDPIAEFARWFAEAQAAEVEEPNAMVLATATSDGTPSARVVLLKGFDERGFVFLHRLPEPEGCRARGQSPRGAGVALERAGATGKDHG